MTADDNELRKLQKQCSRALALYTDYAEAVCEILTGTTTAPLTPSDRARLRTIHRQEMAALRGYLFARLSLMTALSLESIPEFRSFSAAIDAAEQARSRAHA